MTDQDYIRLHLSDDVRALALQKVPEGINQKFCLQQIEGWQLARRKLPRWAACEGILFPPRLAMEQCSSEATALYKQEIVKRILPEEAQRSKMADFTGGFGVDFSFLSVLFGAAVYVEKQEHLCEFARHNLPLLGIPHSEVVCESLTPDSPLLDKRYSFLFIDPARRDENGKKTVFIEDCTPDVTSLQAKLLAAAPVVMVKLSPMLDISAALRSLPQVREIHVVSFRNECKELLLVMYEGSGRTYFCVNLETAEPPFILTENEAKDAKNAHFIEELPPAGFLFEPNASILKAGLQDALSSRFGLRKLHPHSHLFYSDAPVSSFPGRCFRLCAWSDFSKRGLKSLLSGVKSANITLRNFPSTTAALRKRLALNDGGDVYLFATTLADGRHALLRCEQLHCSGTTA